MEILTLISCQGGTKIPLKWASQTTYIVETLGDKQETRGLILPRKPTSHPEQSGLLTLVAGISSAWRTRPFNVALPIQDDLPLAVKTK